MKGRNNDGGSIRAWTVVNQWAITGSLSRNFTQISHVEWTCLKVYGAFAHARRSVTGEVVFYFISQQNNIVVAS